MTENISLKELKKKIKSLGDYKIKTYVYTYRFLEVLDKNKNFIAGAGANVYPKETIKEHKKVFDLLNKYEGFVYDYDYKEPLKVLF